MNDPRSLPGFDPTLYPQCDHADLPTDASAIAARKLEFLAAYYDLNRSYRSLLSLRAAGRPPEEERAALQAIERALLARDALEDKYAPYGVVATPDFENGLVKNISFVQPPGPVVRSSLSMFFAVPPQPGPPA